MIEVKSPLDGSIWSPKSPAQRAALDCSAEILLFGGAAGSLKSETLLVDASQEHYNPNLHALLFRRTFPELEQSLIKRARELYSQMGASFNEQKKAFVWPWGATIRFGHCQRDKDIYMYMGSEYTYVGFDESTHFREFPVRYMLSRMRSTDESMRIRMRLMSNPGSEGHVWHKQMFMGPKCTHCMLMEKSKRPGVLYDNAVWPSDAESVEHTTAFIPGRVTDHDLFGPGGERYVKKLMALPDKHRRALLDGCWDLFEGQYFDCWHDPTMMVRRQTIGELGWWTYWVGIDYGFNKSKAVAYLFCKSPEGKIYVIDEFIREHVKAADFAALIKARWAVDRSLPIVAYYLSPDCWANRGDGHTLADQMMHATGINFEQASNDRIGGAMRIYTLLQNSQLVIADTCTKLAEALPARVHDEDRPDDVLKIVGDVGDDCYDAFRYGVYSYLGPVRKPQHLVLQEAMVSQDPTIAMMQRKITEEKLRKLTDVVSYRSQNWMRSR